MQSQPESVNHEGHEVTRRKAVCRRCRSSGMFVAFAI